MALSFGPSDGKGLNGCGAQDWFFHIPRTGGNFTIMAITKGLDRDGKLVWAKHRGHMHAGPYKIPAEMIYRCFTIVRPPLDWYRSFYRFRITKHYVGANMAPGHPLDKYIWEGQHQSGGHIFTFNEFVASVAAKYPHGYVHSLYMDFVRGVDAVLCTDKLGTELPALMEQWGYDADMRIPPMRRNRTTDDHGNWAPPKKFSKWVRRGHKLGDLPVDIEPGTLKDMQNAEALIIRWLRDRRIM